MCVTFGGFGLPRPYLHPRESKKSLNSSIQTELGPKRRIGRNNGRRILVEDSNKDFVDRAVYQTHQNAGQSSFSFQNQQQNQGKICSLFREKRKILMMTPVWKFCLIKKKGRDQYSLKERNGHILVQE